MKAEPRSASHLDTSRRSI
jgi:hypothetical protein